MNEIIKELAPPSLFEYSVKPKILYIADVPNWSFDIKGKQYRRYLQQFDIDIGYFKTDLHAEYQDRHWTEMIKHKKYDLIWHLHGDNFFNYEKLRSFVQEQNKLGTQVILTQNEVTPYEEIMQKINVFSAYNAISANNPWVLENFNKAGFTNILKTYDGVDLNVFGHDVPIQKRDFKVFFSSSVMRLEHKGYHILEEIKQLLSNRTDIEFVEVIADSFDNKRTQEEMNYAYNECQVFLCLSKSEGGPCTLLEAAACGLVPIMTEVGYCNYFKNLFVVERDAVAFAEKIIFLKDNPQTLIKMSRGISKEILSWDVKFMSQHWGHFAQQVLLRNKGLKML